MKPRYPLGEAGFTLIDVLISVFILAFGMLALARVMAQSSLSEVEASQRSQAMMLVQDMSERINLNRKNAAAYVGSYSATWGPAGGADCSALTGVNADVCEWQNLLAGLDQAFSPARLLGLERRHLNGKLSGTLDVLQVNKFPTFKLRAIGEVGVLRQGIVLPASGFLDGPAPPDAGRSVEIKKNIAPRAPGMFQNEMAVEQNRLNFREEGIMAIDMAPPSLHHADLRIGEVVNRAKQKIFRRNEVGVKNGNEFASGNFHTFR